MILPDSSMRMSATQMARIRVWRLTVMHTATSSRSWLRTEKVCRGTLPSQRIRVTSTSSSSIKVM